MDFGSPMSSYSTEYMDFGLPKCEYSTESWVFSLHLTAYFTKYEDFYILSHLSEENQGRLTDLGIGKLEKREL